MMLTGRGGEISLFLSAAFHQVICLWPVFSKKPRTIAITSMRIAFVALWVHAAIAAPWSSTIRSPTMTEDCMCQASGSSHSALDRLDWIRRGSLT
ncbi:hypothetical protein BX600DRAFT_313894 [Xylariales sp. PMI_506]|nr:hypothetical protein BX600DRAFT_313894 [Xylariales sp. PMI_506]